MEKGMAARWLFVVVIVYGLAACAPTVPETMPTTTLSPVSLPATWTPESSITPSLTPTQLLTFVESELPAGLVVTFMIDDTIQVWEKGEQQEIFSGSYISDASLSPDGQWVRFFQREGQFDPGYDVWAVRSDGTDLHQLLSKDQITSLAADDTPTILDQLKWLPNSQQLVFTTQALTEGPPGYLPNYDLFLLDLSGEVTQLAGPGEGGAVYPSPDGRYIAAAMPSRIGLYDLVTGAYNTILEFESTIGPIGPPRPPVLYWDKDSQLVTTSILPRNVYTPSLYENEPEQIWRLGVDGQAELIGEVQPHPGYGSAVKLSPHAEYYFYFEAGVCLDGAERLLHLRSLTTGDEILEIPCTFAHPEWTPDDEHFIYREEGKWILRNVNDAHTKHLEFLDLAHDLVEYPTIKIEWIDQSHFLQEVSNSTGCTLYLGSLDGIIAEIFQTSGADCSGSGIVNKFSPAADTPRPSATATPTPTSPTNTVDSGLDPNIEETQFAEYWELRSTPMGAGVLTDQVGFHMSQLMNSFDGNLYTWVFYDDEGRSTIVYAGVYPTDILQGKLIVVREGTIWDRMGDHIDLPTRSGRPVIIDAVGQRLMIETEMGDLFYFDVPAGKFADSYTEILPTMTPGPTLTQTP